MPIFLTLGSWQIERATEKQQLLNAEQTAIETAPVPVESIQATRLPVHARAEGKYAEHVFLLDNRIRERRPGYEVLAPLRLDDQQAVLVNLGWVPQGASRQDLPEIEVPTGRVDVTGLAMTPQPPPFQLSDGETFAGGWPKVVQSGMPAKLEQVLDLQLRPVVLYPDGSAIAARKTEALQAFGPSRHHAYAAQWFGFALVLMIVYLWHGLHRGRQQREQEWKRR
ncbi:MAG: SURF1 family protein [Halothiobacillaceae bacterium]|nr:SURF1 family protein [Halothiobacillaceae bacterium]